VQEHAGQRREADVLQRLARIKRHVDVHHGCLSGLYGEAVGAGRRRTVEQCKHRDRCRSGFGLLKPEGAEEGKFLAAGTCRVDSEPPRR